MRNKEALLDGLVERVLARAFTLRIDGDRRQLLRAFATGYRRELLRHPGLLPLATTRPVTTPEALRMLETGAAPRPGPPGRSGRVPNLTPSIRAGLGTPARPCRSRTTRSWTKS
ncbi:AcrR family transcriptional regulator [Nonomuraea thailandensis]|uniref:AcrR family transcriptional regulator n=1 Tax=Nonomuraea thailandensis TaxID=1188745 RepID=A0A9X2GD45_9ACTN|nr:hypothetical protein [Nonomuraea thailandensis]MCP2356721.1 AcrR family transcriptional regulator [Nonomuraea thailandensis]